MTKQNLITAVEFRNLRIPYHPDLAELGIDNISWKVLQETVFPNATSLDAIIMAWAYCRKRSLDIFKRPVHIVPMWSTAARKMIDTVWPSISELRTTAARTGEYGGVDETKFGPEVEETIGGVRLTFPEWAQVTVYRYVKGARCPFVGPKVYWLEAYATKARDNNAPNDMWCRRKHGQIDKCAEAAALRKAFPEEIGNEYCAEEMEGQRLIAAEPIAEPPVPEVEAFQPAGPNDAPVTSPNGQDLPKPPEPPEPRQPERPERPEKAGNELPASEPPIPPATQGTLVSEPPTSNGAGPEPQPPEPPASNDAPLNVSELYRDYYEQIGLAKNEGDLEQIWRRMVAPVFGRLSAADRTQFCDADDRRRGQLV